MSGTGTPTSAAVSDALQPIVDGAAKPSESEGTVTDIDALEQELFPEDSGSSNVDTSSAESIDAAQKAGDISKAEATALKKKLKLKVDGQEFEEEVDFNDEDSLRRHLQKSKAFDKRMQEFSGYKQQVDMILEMLENDPEGLLEKMGKNVDELAESRLRRRVEELKKSPEQLEKERMAKELQELREEKKRIQEEKEMAEMEKMRNQHAIQIQNDIKEALDAQNTVLPKRNPTIIARIGQAMFLAMKNGYPEVTAKDVIPFVEKQDKNSKPNDTINSIFNTDFKGRVYLTILSPISTKRHWNLNKEMLGDIKKIIHNESIVKKIYSDIDKENKMINPFFLIKKYCI